MSQATSPSNRAPQYASMPPDLGEKPVTNPNIAVDDNADQKATNPTGALHHMQLEPSKLERAVLCMTQINETIGFAYVFNQIIMALTGGRCSLIARLNSFSGLGSYPFFQFDPVKSAEISTTLITPEMVDKAPELAEECRLDLIEALAEYNIDSLFFDASLSSEELQSMREGKPFLYKKEIDSSSTAWLDDPEQFTPVELESNRFIQKFILPEGIKGFSAMQKILDEAKRTLKGDFFISEIRPNCDLLETETPFAEVWHVNPENDYWSHHYYYRYHDSPDWNLDLLIGKRESDRLVRTLADGGRLILRCRQQAYRDSGHDFELRLIRGILTCLNDKNWIIEPYSDRLPEIKKKLDHYILKLAQAYGKEELLKAANALKAEGTAIYPDNLEEFLDNK